MRHPPTSIKLSGVSLSRGGQPLIGKLSLRAVNRDVVWLTGVNGVGKTSLLLAMAGLLTVDEGAVIWTSNAEPATPRDVVSYAAHAGPERRGLNLGEEMAFWQAAYSDPLSTEERLSEVGLKGRERTPVSGLSAGQRRRLALARLLAEGKPIWLMDEPLAGLDGDGRRLVEQAVTDHVADGGIAVIASHHPVSLPDLSARKLVLRA